mmetsp:Transcript_4063/g.5957  ORF Transcript_4063/g.5957 Transcript_4063/m.5957 type:complete len:82 (+) Transcript_4063:114-359(+)
MWSKTLLLVWCQLKVSILERDAPSSEINKNSCLLALLFWSKSSKAAWNPNKSMSVFCLTKSARQMVMQCVAKQMTQSTLKC